MLEQQEIRNILNVELISTVMQLKSNGYRLVQICSTTIKDGYELTYSFSINYELIGLRFVIQTNDEVMSISPIYSYAFLYENEIKDLFGIDIKLISIDYAGHFYKIKELTPFKNKGMI